MTEAKPKFVMFKCIVRKFIQNYIVCHHLVSIFLTFPFSQFAVTMYVL